MLPTLTFPYVYMLTNLMNYVPEYILTNIYIYTNRIKAQLFTQVHIIIKFFTDTYTGAYKITILIARLL